MVRAVGAPVEEISHALFQESQRQALEIEILQHLLIHNRKMSWIDHLIRWWIYCTADSSRRRSAAAAGVGCQNEVEREDVLIFVVSAVECLEIGIGAGYPTTVTSADHPSRRRRCT